MHRIATLVLALVVAAPQAAPTKPDLSTPEAAVRSFVSSFFSGEVRRAGMCVMGVAQDPRLAAAEQQMKVVPVKPADRPVVADVKATVNGESATAHVTYATPLPRGTAEAEDVTLRRFNGEWKIVPLDAAALKKAGAEMDANRNMKLRPIAVIAGSLANLPVVLAAANDAARRTVCLSNLKQVEVAALMFVQDSDEKLAIRADSFKKALMPYSKNEGIFHCPSDHSGQVSYAFNARLQGVKQAAIRRPAETVMFYEGHGGRLDFRHDGKACVGFADGHVKMLDAAAAKSLRWAP